LRATVQPRPDDKANQKVNLYSPYHNHKALTKRSSTHTPSPSRSADDSSHITLPMDVILSVLGQDKRLDILRALLEAETGCGVTSLSKTLSLKAPTVEKHLATLRRIGLVKKQMTLDFARERWMIRGQKRVIKLLNLLDEDVRGLVEVGHVFEEVEKAVRRQQYYKEQAASVQEMENGRKEGEKLDKLLQELGKQHTPLLDEDELKKVNYWINARSLGVL